MKIVELHSHLNGYEWLLVHEPGIWAQIEDTIKSVDALSLKTKISKEKTMKGRELYSPKEINRAFVAAFQAIGTDDTTNDDDAWAERRTSYWVSSDYDLVRQTMQLPASKQKETIEAAGREAILSYNQTDFVCRRVAVEVQFGKYSFIAYDLFVKHLAFYVGNEIDVGVEILPMKSMQRDMSSGPGYYEGALYDVARQGRGVPAVPLVLVGVVP